jgi:uncharacterized protein (TIGR02145 family)
VFNVSTSFCYDGIVYSKCNGMGYNPSTHICDGSAAYPAECGGWQYNPLEDGCCGSEIFPLSKYGCCASSLFRLSDERCQKDVVETKCGTSSDYYNSETRFCVDNKVYDKCNGQTYNPEYQRCGTGNVIENKCGTSSDYYNSETRFCVDNKVYDKCNGQSYILISQRCGAGGVIETKCGSNWFNPSTYTQYCKNGTTLTQYGSFEYAGQTYRTVEIGTQTWMAENFNYNASGSKCGKGNSLSDANTPTCDKYGRLYNWSTAMNGALSSNTNPSNVRGVCPSGWHLPSSTEWATLTDFVGGSFTAGTKLKAAAGWNDYNGSSGNGTDEFGFAALPGGHGNSDGLFNYAGSYGIWWSSSEDDAYNAYGRGMYYDDEDVSYYGNNKSYLRSVRCLQDSP